MDLTPGAELPALVRKTGFPHWNRFAAVNDEFIPIHMDDSAGRESGFPSAIGMGNLVWSYFHNLLRDWMGPGGRVEKINCRYQLPNLRDSTITMHGKITDVTRDGEAARVVIDLWVDDENDRRLAAGKARVLV
jgi:acyl dehydratase